MSAASHTNQSTELPIAMACAGASQCRGSECSSRKTAACERMGENASALLDSPDHVLSTLEKDGSRRWLRPKLSMGKLWKSRRAVAYFLMGVFVAVPHLRIDGKPLILIDIIHREFTFFGKTFLPTDTLLLALLMLSVFITIVLVTAVTGRAWCGWACPQTVYMEFLFRPIDRLFDGTIGKGGKAKADISGVRQFLRLSIYLLLSMFLAHTFLSYFVGTDQLAKWIQGSPIRHPIAFLVMAATTGLMLFDFLFFREQLCIIACPYGRFQSVMLDRQSMIVAYDPVRGEPRKKGKRPTLADGERKTAGDCVDCNQCVVVCPTGIDIRDGLQMECINCTQCIDACNDVMDRVGLPQGLIRFSSQDEIDRKPKQVVRGRTIAYAAILTIVLSGFAWAVATKSTFDARVIRGQGAPFTIDGDFQVLNSFKLRLVNRTDAAQVYSLEIETPNGIEIQIVDTDDLRLDAGESKMVPIHLRFSSDLTDGDGNERVQMNVTDSDSNSRTVGLRILGPN